MLPRSVQYAATVTQASTRYLRSRRALSKFSPAGGPPSRPYSTGQSSQEEAKAGENANGRMKAGKETLRLCLWFATGAAGSYFWDHRPSRNRDDSVTKKSGFPEALRETIQKAKEFDTEYSVDPTQPETVYHYLQENYILVQTFFGTNTRKDRGILGTPPLQMFERLEKMLLPLELPTCNKELLEEVRKTFERNYTLQVEACDEIHQILAQASVDSEDESCEAIIRIYEQLKATLLPYMDDLDMVQRLAGLASEDIASISPVSYRL